MQILRYANRWCANVGRDHPDGTKITFGFIRFEGALLFGDSAVVFCPTNRVVVDFGKIGLFF
jgi:hypothetical protein